VIVRRKLNSGALKLGRKKYLSPQPFSSVFLDSHYMHPK